MPPKISIVLAEFNNRYDYVTDALIKSINSLYSDVEILRIGTEIPSTDNELLQNMQENYWWAKRSPGSLRNILWNQGLKIAKSEWVVFLDADMLLLKKLENILSIVESNNSEFVFTWRPAQPYWINMGFLMIKKNDQTLSFFDELVQNQIENVKLGIGAGQYTFQNMLKRSNMELNEIINCQDKNKIFYFNQANINFAGISCYKLNNIYHTEPIGDDVHVIHLKGALGTMLLREKDVGRRYQNYLNWDLFRFSLKEIEFMNNRLKLWKSFSDNKSPYPIDIYSHYKRRRYLRILFICLKYLKNLFFSFKNIFKGFSK